MKKTLITLSAAMFATGLAVAGEKMGQKNDYEALDQNSDGLINSDEAAQSRELSEAWTQVDTNQDGVIDKSEFSAFEAMGPKPEKSE